MTDTEFGMLIVGMGFTFVVMAIFSVLNSRASYCNGVHDGYRFCERPWDDPYKNIGITKILVARGEKL